MADKLYDVVINGCGPTGLISALLLARAGHSVAICDRYDEIYPLPRAIGYDHEVARILNILGLSAAMEPLTAKPDVYQWRNAQNELLFELTWGVGASISGFRNSYLFSQPEMERVLNDAAAASPLIDVLRGVDIQDVQQDAGTVSLLGQRRNGEKVVCSGKWLIGADGANSTVRRCLGLSLDNLGFEADWLVVDVLPLPGQRLPFDDGLMLQVCDPARPTTVVSGGPGRRRWEFMALGDEVLADLNSPECAWKLLAPWGLTPDNAVLERHAVYTFRGAVAPRWREGRGFLAGDAAHLTPPFAGQGLCAGFRDAAAIAWRLDLALRGKAGDAVLNSYESERREHARAWVMNAIDLGKVICVLDPAEAAGRDAGMLAARREGLPPPAASALPSLGDGLFLPNHHGGALAVGGNVLCGGVQGHLDDVAPTGFVLVGRDTAALPALGDASRAAFQALGGVCIAFGPDGDCEDSEGTYRNWLAGIDADVALIRPDFYLFGAMKGPDQGCRRAAGGGAAIGHWPRYCLGRLGARQPDFCKETYDG
jgi:resorcinol 4-hydroxylase (NADPH)